MRSSRRANPHPYPLLSKERGGPTEKFGLIIRSSSPAQTIRAAQKLAGKLEPGAVLALEGELGSGKTCFAKGLAKGLGLDPRKVRSPTFALIHEYRGKKPLCHADLYRLDAAGAWSAGLEEYLKSNDWITAVEWPERARQLLPPDMLKVKFEFVSENERRITFTGGAKWRAVLRYLRQQFRG